MSHPDEAVLGSYLTTSERHALEAVLRHGTVKGAATALGKSPRTVEHQLANVRARLGVTTTIEAVRLVFVAPDMGEFTG
jgi:FixJ family two-component response regulator